MGPPHTHSPARVLRSDSRLTVIDVELSVRFRFSHRAWTKTSRTEGGVGACSFPLLADYTKQIAKDCKLLAWRSSPEAAHVHTWVWVSLGGDTGGN